jgi:hypothetical protein
MAIHSISQQTKKRERITLTKDIDLLQKPVSLQKFTQKINATLRTESPDQPREASSEPGD